MQILADSGILIRLQEPVDPLHATVMTAVSMLLSQGHDIVTAPQNIAEFWNVCTRPATSRGGLGLGIVETERRTKMIEKTLVVLGEIPVAYGIWRSLIVTHGVKGKQVHDARLVALMQAYGITHILTLNGADFARYPGITVLDPTAIAVPPTP